VAQRRGARGVRAAPAGRAPRHGRGPAARREGGGGLGAGADGARPDAVEPRYPAGRRGLQPPPRARQGGRQGPEAPPPASAGAGQRQRGVAQGQGQGQGEGQGAGAAPRAGPPRPGVPEAPRAYSAGGGRRLRCRAADAGQRHARARRRAGGRAAVVAVGRGRGGGEVRRGHVGGWD